MCVRKRLHSISTAWYFGTAFLRKQNFHHHWSFIHCTCSLMCYRYSWTILALASIRVEVFVCAIRVISNSSKITQPKINDKSNAFEIFLVEWSDFFSHPTPAVTKYQSKLWFIHRLNRLMVPLTKSCCFRVTQYFCVFRKRKYLAIDAI